LIYSCSDLSLDFEIEHTYCFSCHKGYEEGYDDFMTMISEVVSGKLKYYEICCAMDLAWKKRIKEGGK